MALYSESYPPAQNAVRGLGDRCEPKYEQPRTPSEVEDSLSGLRSDVDCLAKSLSVLRDRLSPAMRPAAPASERVAGGQCGPSFSPLAERLHGTAMQVRQIGDGVQDMLDRLGL